MSEDVVWGNGGTRADIFTEFSQPLLEILKSTQNKGRELEAKSTS
jgi:hypothetical protein